MNGRIREYRETDIEACCDIFVSNMPEFFLPHELQGYREYLKAYAVGTYWVIESSARLIACGGIHIKEGEGTLCFGLVRKDFHRHRLGSVLLAYRMVKLLEHEDLARVRLDTSQHNPDFFSKFGFKTTGVIENHYGPGLHRYDMLLEIEPSRRQEIKAEFNARVSALCATKTSDFCFDFL